MKLISQRTELRDSMAILTRKIRLDALQSMNEYSRTRHWNLSRLCHDAPLDFTSRPKGVSDLAPRLCWVCAVVAGAIFADRNAGARLYELEINDG